MQAALDRDFISVDDYLAGEETSPVRHEYIAGAVYAMAGTTRDHNQIAGNIYAAVRPVLSGTRCRAFIIDVKVRLNIGSEDVLYYPDVMVGCDPRDTHKLYLHYPKILVEVSSDSTERLDRHEKKAAYETIETLEEYLLVAQDRPEVTVFRRANHWRPEISTRLDDSVTLDSIGLTFPLSSIYEGVIPAASAPR